MMACIWALATKNHMFGLVCPTAQTFELQGLSMALKGNSRGALAVCIAPKKTVVESPFNAEYLRRLKCRDREIEDHFHSYFRQKLLLKLRGRRLQQSDVQDIIQETLMRVLKAVDKEEIRIPVAFGGYVSRVCDFVLYDFIDHYEPYVDVDEVEMPDPTPGHDTLFLRREKREIVIIVLNGLRPRDRNLLRAKLFDELSSEEMCERFGVSSVNHLRLLLHRARKKFADAYQKREMGFLQR